jgi:hypothetical protein
MHTYGTYHTILNLADHALFLCPPAISEAGARRPNVLSNYGVLSSNYNNPYFSYSRPFIYNFFTSIDSTCHRELARHFKTEPSEKHRVFEPIDTVSTD